MNLTLEGLQEMGAFTGAGLVEKEITWKQGAEEFTAVVYVRPLSYKTAVTELTAGGSKNDPLASRIAGCICDAAGEPIFSAADITGDADPERGPLNHGLTMALLGAISEASGLGKGQATSAK